MMNNGSRVCETAKRFAVGQARSAKHILAVVRCAWRFIKVNILRKRLWLIGTSYYHGFDPNKGHLFTPGKDHYFFGTKEEMILHLDSHPNADCAWDVCSDCSDRIGDIGKSILALIRRK